jgi:hypothetical protein
LEIQRPEDAIEGRLTVHIQVIEHKTNHNAQTQQHQQTPAPGENP